LDLAAIVAGNLPRVEAIERGAIVLAFLQDGVPAQSGLRALENKEFEERGVVVRGNAPFFIVIADGKIVARPGATGQICGL
jgi:hypothetical protein